MKTRQRSRPDSGENVERHEHNVRHALRAGSHARGGHVCHVFLIGLQNTWRASWTSRAWSAPCPPGSLRASRARCTWRNFRDGTCGTNHHFVTEPFSMEYFSINTRCLHGTRLRHRPNRLSGPCRPWCLAFFNGDSPHHTAIKHLPRCIGRAPPHHAQYLFSAPGHHPEQYPVLLLWKRVSSQCESSTDTLCEADHLRRLQGGQTPFVLREIALICCQRCRISRDCEGSRSCEPRST